MSAKTVKSELRAIARRMPRSAAYSDAMYEFYVRMKIAKGRQAADEGMVVSHKDARRRLGV